jgi:hypothetical protein
MTHHHHDHDAVAGSSPRRYSFVAVLSVLILLAAVAAGAFFWLGGFPSATGTEDKERSAVRAKNLAELQAADQTALTTYGWADRSKGIVRIPVARAEELVIPELNARSPKTAAAASTPVQQ